MLRWSGICGLVLAFCCATAGAARAASHWQPPQQLTWYWQLTGTPNVEPVDATDIDGFDSSVQTVAAFHARGQHVICYIDVGTAENWRPDYGEFPASVLGSSNGWPGEQWLDIRQLSILEPIMTARFQMCKQKGFDAVEPDNMDGYENATGFPITAADQLTYDEWVANEVHSLGMAVLQKNDPDQAGQLEPYFDGALSEQCNQYSECSEFEPYLAAGKPVLDAEYQSSLYPGFCASDQASGIMGALYDLNLDGALFDPCFGPSVTTPGSPGAGSGSTTASPPGTRAGGPIDRRRPLVVISRGPLVDERGAVRVRLSCRPAQSYCAGMLVLESVGRLIVRARSGRRLVLGREEFLIRGGKSAVLTVRLERRAMRALGRRKRVAVVLKVTDRDRAGRTASSKRSLALRLRGDAGSQQRRGNEELGRNRNF